jgi:hypothetical protein
MNQNRKDQRESTTGRGSVMDDQETFEHGSGPSDMAKGMGSSGERGKGSSGDRSKGSSGQGQQPSRAERGRSQSEDR